MKSVLLRAALALALAPSCAVDSDAMIARDAMPIEGQWTLLSADAPTPGATSTVVTARLNFDELHAWTLRYDYHLADAPAEHVWSSGVSGTWESQPGARNALRLTVSSDSTDIVATMPTSGRIELSILGQQMRFVRAPE